MFILSTTELLKHVESRFSISIEPSVPIRFVHITNVVSEVPLSMVAQSFASMKVSYRALNKVNPDIFFDTTGCAFTFLVARVLAGCKVAAYVHYPTISTDMLALVWDRRPTYNNDSKISSSMIRSYLKMLYYILFSIAYGFVGSLATLVMVNSTWTNNHIRYLWRFAKKTDIVYPPCDTQSLEDLSLNGREEVIISIGQFRPEKDHALQLRAFSILLHSNTSKRFENVRMKLIGSCRGESDKMRVRQLQKLAKKLDLTDRVEFVLNQPYPVLKKWFGRASIGIHTMWNEHFGIGVVEMLAAGLVTIAHKSGGPKSDIISPGENGYLASTAEEYAQIMAVVLEGGADSRKNIDIRQKARESAKRFSDQIFSDAFEKVFLSSGLLQ